MSRRAVQVLRDVDLIAAEDTRHSRTLLHRFDIRTPLLALHEHNERRMVERLLRRLTGGASLALISDAGTPLVSDPGFLLVQAARAAGIRVSPVPGPSALLAALSVAGLPTHDFLFLGFPPRTPAQRAEWAQGLAHELRTMVLFESSHRVLGTLQDLAEWLGPDRQCCLARELTKLHETVLKASFSQLSAILEKDPEQRKGEFVLVVAGAVGEASRDEQQLRNADRVVEILDDELPLGKAVALAARITGLKKNLLYRRALERSAEHSG
jgi:16S rRNA (cytidine1402-2'-O)-methyltransferase